MFLGLGKLQNCVFKKLWKFGCSLRKDPVTACLHATMKLNIWFILALVTVVTTVVA